MLSLLLDGLDVADAEQDEEHRHVCEVAHALSVQDRRNISLAVVGCQRSESRLKSGSRYLGILIGKTTHMYEIPSNATNMTPYNIYSLVAVFEEQMGEANDERLCISRHGKTKPCHVQLHILDAVVYMLIGKQTWKLAVFLMLSHITNTHHICIRSLPAWRRSARPHDP